jgi:hypothetical protein
MDTTYPVVVYAGTKLIELTDSESLGVLKWAKDTGELSMSNYDVSIAEGDRDKFAKTIAARGGSVSFKVDRVVRVKDTLSRKDGKGRSSTAIGARIGTLVVGKHIKVLDKDGKAVKKCCADVSQPYTLQATDTSYAVLLGVYFKAHHAPPAKKPSKPSA